MASGRRLRVSARRDLADSLIGTGIPHSLAAATSRNGPRSTTRLHRKSRAFAASARPRSISPGSRPAGWTASGKTTSTCGTRPPAFCWSREAGGFVTDYRGSRPLLRTRRICRRVVGNPLEAAEAGRGSYPLIGLLALAAAAAVQPQTLFTINPKHRLVEGVASDGDTIFGIEHSRPSDPRLPNHLPLDRNAACGTAPVRAWRGIGRGSACGLRPTARTGVPGITPCERGALVALDCRWKADDAHRRPSLDSFHPGRRLREYPRRVCQR